MSTGSASTKRGRAIRGREEGERTLPLLSAVRFLALPGFSACGALVSLSCARSRDVCSRSTLRLGSSTAGGGRCSERSGGSSKSDEASACDGSDRGSGRRGDDDVPACSSTARAMSACPSKPPRSRGSSCSTACCGPGDGAGDDGSVLAPSGTSLRSFCTCRRELTVGEPAGSRRGAGEVGLGRRAEGECAGRRPCGAGLDAPTGGARGDEVAPTRLMPASNSWPPFLASNVCGKSFSEMRACARPHCERGKRREYLVSSRATSSAGRKRRRREDAPPRSSAGGRCGRRRPWRA